jgi:hypothetical protein
VVEIVPYPMNTALIVTPLDLEVTWVNEEGEIALEKVILLISLSQVFSPY